MPSVRVMLSDTDIARALTRISHEIVEKTRGARDVVLLGIPTRGVYLAQRIAERINAFYGPEAGLPSGGIPVGSLDVTMYRDDLRLRPARSLLPTVIPEGGIENKTVVLIDDVLYSGRTVRAGLDALGEYGRPKAVQLAVLIDRGHRELPIRADYVGKNLPTSTSERVHVRLAEIDETDAVVLSK